ncbi:MAG: hypothetical protein DCC71_19805 [Proteobacteria bacterium]|nr:MAG: hypothetical protein DCC71_19805 [Pseudomonadota bacterium]
MASSTAEPRRERLALLLAGPLLLLPALTSFLAHNAYGLTRPEALLAMALLAGAGLGASAVAVLGPRWLRPLVFAALLLLAIDLQTRWTAGLGTLGLLAVFAVLAALVWLLREHVGTLLCVVFGTLWLTSFFVPAVGLWAQGPPTAKADADAAADAALPTLLHVILDEHIGVEGIPAEFDPGHRLANALQEALVGRGFSVFGRAYSRHYDTTLSVPSVLNFQSGEGASLTAPVGAGHRLTANAWLERMHERGYRTHVLESDFLALCEAGGAQRADSCSTYNLESADSIEDAALAVSEKAHVLLASFARLSSLLQRVRAEYAGLRAGPVGAALPLPDWPAGYERISSLSAMRALDAMEARLRAARPGEAFLVHVMLPHYPYTYDDQCRLEPDVGRWLYALAPEAAPRQNTAATRRERYPLYLAQVACTQRRVGRLLDALEQAGVYERAIVVVHGDHGSRLDTGPPVAANAPTLTAADLIDGFSTLFAAKLPGQPAVYDRRVLPLDLLVAHAVLDGAIPPGADWAPAPSVFLSAAAGAPARAALPSFAWGAATDAVASEPHALPR